MQWLTSSFDEQHYLFYMLSKVDIRVLVIQFCTHMLAAGVIKRLEEDEVASPIFKVQLYSKQQGFLDLQDRHMLCV